MTIHHPFRSALAFSSLALALAACAEPIEDRPDTEETAIPVEPDGGIGDGAGPPEMVDGDIPPALHGRWGLVPEDCTSDRGDAKGLVNIDAEGIQFYESRGVVDTVSQSDPGSFRATYAFSGEGQEWNRDMELTLSEDGTTITRSEFGEEALAEPLTYTKCPA
ncbi:hypothetical protein [Qipengyuania sphaerica]|uniref:hypothetical protein n=1 Tax=Qipengyuania sphaerica TaxID=2867243 RepID=UPI001C871AA2|nr:hypothetical protein [Qipengyuania sphaerica]MBX7539780.1 hypothetical protein [Qipengyuania sphaerica]